MKFFVAQRIQQPLSDADAAKWLPQHGGYMQVGVDAGMILVAGPKTEGDGGYTIMSAASRADAEAFLAEDPMVKAGLQHYELTEFIPLSHMAAAETWCSR